MKLLTLPRYRVLDGRGRSVRFHPTKRVAQIHATVLARDCRRDQEIRVIDTQTGREVAECDWSEGGAK